MMHSAFQSLKYRAFVLFIPFLFAEFVNGQSLVQLVEDLEPSVFKIECYDEYGMPEGTGTGFIVGEDGRAVTNWHVMDETAFAFAIFDDSKIVEITSIIEASEQHDLVVIQLAMSEGMTYTPLRLQKTIPPKGSELFIIGCPSGYTNFVSKGLVSAFDDSEGHTLIQSEASISGGSSGSPAFNFEGQVIGVATSSLEDGQNLNFLTPIEYLDEATDSFSSTALTGKSASHFVFHRRCIDSPSLMLHAIECMPEKTVVYLSYTNSSLLLGDEATIYSSVNDEDLRFRFTNLATGEEIHVLNGTIGESSMEPTMLELGETKYFEMVFPPLEVNQKYRLSKGAEGAKWTFKEVDLSHPGMSFSSIKDMEELEFLYYLLVTEDDLAYYGWSDISAYLGNELMDGRELTAFEANLAGVIAYIDGNDGTATQYFEEASEKAPLFDEPWSNLYWISDDYDYESQITLLDQAMRASPDSPDLHYWRGGVQLELDRPIEAEKDYQFFIDSDHVPWGSAHEYCAYAQWDQEKVTEGCLNYQLAIELYVDQETVGWDYLDDMLYLLELRCGKKVAKSMRKNLYLD